MWFTEQTGNQIGRITTDGSITEFPIPAANSAPAGIAAGADGAMWFTEAGAIGRIRWLVQPYRHFEFNEFKIPSQNVAVGIVAGADGALWFTERGGLIGRITTGGTFTEYAIPTPYSNPLGIAAGPDGALWFAEEGGFFAPAEIGRITTGGSISEFALRGRHYEGIATGPDGALWYTWSPPIGSSGLIGRITTTGSFAEYMLPSQVSSTTPFGITAGPDGAMWFTEASVNRIGRIATAGLGAASISRRRR